MQRIEGVVQHYAWGDREFIPSLLGVEPDGEPWAELWLGTHPTGPARLADGTPLDSVTGELPYLLKVLAAGEPLSLQTHPTVEQAADGFTRGVFPDGNAKPELLCALGPFEALCGIRPPHATLSILHELGPRTESLGEILAADGPGAALAALYRGRVDHELIVDACRRVSRPEARWVARLADRYPGDPSVAATLLLNYVELSAGEALRLDAGNLHAYLSGAGVELMGASDNVVRGGLTAKHVDVDLLLGTVDPTPLAEPVLPFAPRYELPGAGVVLVHLDPGEVHHAAGHELAIDLSGGQWYAAPGEQFVVDAEAYVVTPL